MDLNELPLDFDDDFFDALNVDYVTGKPVNQQILPSVAGSKPQQTLLFESVSEYVSPVARVDSRT